MGQDLPNGAAKLILAALRPYARLFHLPEEALGCTDRVEHHIEVEGAALIWQRPHRVPIHRRELVEKVLQRMLVEQIIKLTRGLTGGAGP